MCGVWGGGGARASSVCMPRACVRAVRACVRACVCVCVCVCEATSLILSGRLSWVRRLQLPQDRAAIHLPASVCSIIESCLAVRLPFWFNARVWLPEFEIFNVNTERLMHAVVHGVCTNTVTGSKLKVD